MTAAEAARWISVPAGSGQARVRLLCLPHAGSGAAGYFRWRRSLPAAIAVCPVLLPGRETRLAEPLRTSLDELVGCVHEAAQALEFDQGRVAIFGHSMGSLLAYELARRMPMETLFASGREAPDGTDRRPQLHELEDREFLDGVRQRYGLSASGLLDDPELRAIFLPILKADLTVVETYQYVPGEMLGCPIYALAGEEDGSVQDDELRRWGGLTRGRFTAGRLPGDHFYLTGAGQEGLLKMLEQVLVAERFRGET